MRMVSFLLILFYAFETEAKEKICFFSFLPLASHSSLLRTQTSMCVRDSREERGLRLGARETGEKERDNKPISTGKAKKKVAC